MGDLFGGGDLDWEGKNTGTPSMPAFMSNIDKNGYLKDQYRLQQEGPVQFQDTMPETNARLGGINLNSDALNALRDYGTSTGDSPWAKAQLGQLETAQGKAMGDAAKTAASSGAAAQDTLASRGGMSSGARENLARNSSNNAMMNTQGVIGQGLQQKGAIRSQDESNRLGVLQNLPGQEVQALQPELQKQSLWQQAAGQNQAAKQNLDTQQQAYRTNVNQTNLGSAIGGLNAQNNFNLEGYKNQLATQAGTEQAKAQENRGKK